MGSKKNGKTQAFVKGHSNEGKIITPQYEYARKEVDSWPAWKKEISMSGLAINYNQKKEA